MLGAVCLPAGTWLMPGYPALSAQLRERVDGAAVRRAMKSQAASTRIKIVKRAVAFVADGVESRDLTFSLAVAADGRYCIDPKEKIKPNGRERVVCDGEHQWLWAGNRLFCWPPEPLPAVIAAVLDPSPLLGRQGSRAGVGTEVDGRPGTKARAAFPELTTVDPLSGGGLSADAAEFVIDDRLGVALRASWLYQGECLLSTELTKVTETVDDQVFQVEPSPGTRVITSRNPLAVVTAKDAVASAWMITTDLVKWISRPQSEHPD